jgi:nitrate/nitrite transporter NarK
MAAETYPTELRATCHGISAFLGKCGALVATIVFAYLEADQIFFTCAATSVVGLFLTALFSVDLTRVPLAEHDAQLELFQIVPAVKWDSALCYPQVVLIGLSC